MLWEILLHILFLFGILIIVNIPAPFLGLKFDSENSRRPWFAPPAFVIPIVWFFLFTLLGIALYKVRQCEPSVAWTIVTLALLCATYAYYTLGLQKITGISALWFGLWGNLGVIIFSAYACGIVFSVSQIAGTLVLPIPAWTAFATLIVVGELKRDKMI